ncbi:DUF6776 family protein [Novilysobacter spongiicola]|uniref:Transmembrane protein n=1 Tax=Lysobacter spongiicola DSM 21749 TaxID=1122188 RepID=A0A1T4QJ13_9GAMM|nr:DUF6776 family protein [Lysobacter spongiicola]SKA03780.1 hypothetical protein SAMN02745674_01647 [Lysobacter spongiicola DSM 21749]
MGSRSHSGYVIVPRQRRGYLAWVLLALAWSITLAAAWLAASWIAAPTVPGLAGDPRQARQALEAAESELEALRQRQATLERSDQISRAANRKVQQALAERDEEIADLRENLAFYERLAAGEGKPRGLNVHSAEFVAEDAGTWRYQIVLTQNLERGAVSAGKLSFSIEGVRDGKLATIGWDDLKQRKGAPAQAYSFRYFQQLDGSVMLPAGFTPQRVRVSLRGRDASLDQAIAWVQPPATGDT